MEQVEQNRENPLWMVRNIVTVAIIASFTSASYIYMVLKMGITPGMSIVCALMAYSGMLAYGYIRNTLVAWRYMLFHNRNSPVFVSTIVTLLMFTLLLKSLFLKSMFPTKHIVIGFLSSFIVTWIIVHTQWKKLCATNKHALNLQKKITFTAQENNLVQTACTAATSLAFMSVVIVALKIMNYNLSHMFTFIWLTVASAMGVLMAVPLRQQFIEKEDLPFPDGVAAAEVLTSLENPTGDGHTKAIALGIASIATILYAIGRNILGWIPKILFGSPAGYAIGLYTSPVMFGVGMLVGIRICIWMLIASMITWKILAPWLVASGIAKATAVSFGMTKHLAAKAYYPVLMRWLMWPATVLLVMAGLTALMLRWRIAVASFKSLGLATNSEQEGFSTRVLAISGLILTLALILVQKFSILNVHPMLTIIGIVLSFFLAVVGIRAAGETGIGPVSVMGSMTQVVFGVISPGNAAVNMATSGATGCIAAQSQDVMFDYKTGHIIGANPRHMTVAQLVGLPIGAAMVTIFLPFMLASYKLGAAEGLPAPTAFKWKAFADILTKGFAALPQGVLIAMLIAAIAGVILAIVEYAFGSSIYIPSSMAIGIAMLLPSFYVINIALGGIFYWFWKLADDNFEWSTQKKYGIAIASALIAGAALIDGIVVPIIKLMGK